MDCPPWAPRPPGGRPAVAFDADLGREPHGRVLLTWSRCTHDGVDSYPNPSFDFSRARGCRLWSLRLDVPAAVPHHLRLRGDARLSLTTPSVHDGSVVAVAAPRRGSHNVRMLLWRKSTRRPVRLRGGTADCPNIPEAYPTCRRGPRTGVDALDLGPRSIAYTWRNPQNGYGTAGGIELRTATLRPSGPTIQVPRTNGFVADGSLRQPSSPTALANGGVGFLLIEEPCFCLHSMLAVAPSDGELWRGVRPSDAVALGAAFDGDRVYWLRGRKLPLAGDIEDPYENGPYPCAAPGVDCRLVVSDALPYRAPTLARQQRNVIVTRASPLPITAVPERRSLAKRTLPPAPAACGPAPPISTTWWRIRAS